MKINIDKEEQFLLEQLLINVDFNYWIEKDTFYICNSDLKEFKAYLANRKLRDIGKPGLQSVVDTISQVQDKIYEGEKND